MTHCPLTTGQRSLILSARPLNPAWQGCNPGKHGHGKARQQS